MQNWIITKILSFIGQKLNGYKTKISGLGFFLLALLGGIRVIFPDQTQFPDIGYQGVIAAASTGMAAFGIAGKADKLTAAIQAKKGGK